MNKKTPQLKLPYPSTSRASQAISCDPRTSIEQKGVIASPESLIPAVPDVMSDLLADKRSPNTRKAYAKDLKDFFNSLNAGELTPQLVERFLQLDRFSATSLVLKYKHQLRERGLKDATINRRLSAIKSLVAYAYKVGKCSWTLAEVIKCEKVTPYRDTTGISREDYRKMLAIPDRNVVKGKRDYALLRLLWDNALRRGEIASCRISNVDWQRGTLAILGKGKGQQQEIIKLSPPTIEALKDWLFCREPVEETEPLFISLSGSSYGQPLTGNGFYKVVREIAWRARIEKLMSPHRARHSAITAALDATGGDVRRVQQLSRHCDLNTLIVYDDNRRQLQGEVTSLLADLIEQ